MKNSYLKLAFGLLLCLGSCTDEVKDAKEAMELDDTKVYTQFHANIVDDMADTRSLLVNNKSVFFEEGDGIQLYVDDNITTGVYYTLDYQTSSNTFDVPPGYAPIPGSQFYAIYPQGAAFNGARNKYVMALEHNFIYRRDSYSGTQHMPMWGEGAGNNVLNFHIMAGLLRFSLSGSIKVTKITLKGNNGEQIGGGAEIDPTLATPYLKMVPGYAGLEPAYEQVMTVAEDEPYVELSASPTSFYFVVPPITFTKGITITIEAEGLNHSIVKSTDKAVEVGRGVMKTFTSVDTDAILNAEADVQLDALKALYNSTNGKAWTSKWDITKPLSDADAWPGVTADAFGVVTKIDLSNNNLSGTLPAELGNLEFVTDVILSGNKLMGGIPAEVAKMTSLRKFHVDGNMMNDSVPYAVFTSDVWAHADRKLNQRDGYTLKTKYVSSDYSKDNELRVLQTHDYGDGIPIVITCEGYSDDMVDEFYAQAPKAMEAFFEIAPYSDFQPYFDVYTLMAVSANNEVGLNLAYGTTYSSDAYELKFNKVKARLEELSVLGYTSSDVLAIVLLNDDGDGHRARCWFDTNGSGAALIPHYNGNEERVKKVIHHEAGGHGFAFLADEYSSDGSRRYGEVERQNLDIYHSFGWSLNLDYNNTQSTVIWKDFWNDDAYEAEHVGAYEGGDASYKYGVYRCTENSTMNDQNVFDKFNPQSRWVIVQQIVRRAGYAQPTVEWFKGYDEYNITAAPLSPPETRSNYVERQDYLLGAPPVRIIE